MQEKLTILISPKHKKFLKSHARKHNKSISRVIDDLLASLKREAKEKPAKDEWIDKTAGAFKTGHKDILNDLLKNGSK